MFRKCIYLLLILLYTSHAAKAQGINFFNGSLAEAKAEAKKQNKFLIIDGFTDWCGWCKYMDKNIYPVKEVGDFYNAHYIFLEMNMEKGEGIEVARQYRLNSYPSFLFFDSAGAFVHYYFGASREYHSFITLGQTAIDSMHNCRGLAFRFYKGERDPAFLRELITTAGYYADPKIIEGALSVYWSAIPDNQLIDNSNWELFKYYEADINSRPYTYIAAHKAAFFARYHEKDDTNILCLKAVLAIKKAIDAKDDTTFLKARQIALTSPDKQIRYTVCDNEFAYYAQKGRMDDFYADVDQYTAKFGIDWLWGLASTMESGTSDHKILSKALEYITQSLNQTKNYTNMDIYALILYKLGLYDDAMTSANSAMELAKNIADGEERTRDINQTGSLIDQIKKSAAEKK